MTEPREDIADESKSRERFPPNELFDRFPSMAANILIRIYAVAFEMAERDTRERCAQTYEGLIADRCTDFRMIAEAIRKGGE